MNLKTNKMKKEIEEIVEFILNPKHSQDSENKDYLSDGEVLDIVTTKLQELVEAVEEPTLVGGWGIEDVETIYGELQENGDITGDYSDEFGQRVMEKMEKEFDASVGISWDTIREYIIKLKNK